ncbi:MAG TPA: hypothetical protein VMI54_19910 [Polyangiaceae bacterium]|nr:hypothetical protein [Polyangiaceae bacterium]
MGSEQGGSAGSSTGGGATGVAGKTTASGGGVMNTGGTSGTGGTMAGRANASGGANDTGGSAGTTAPSAGTGAGGTGIGGSVSASGAGGQSAAGGGTALAGTGSGGQNVGGGGAGGASSDCPAAATFCSDFETDGLPMGAIYMVNAAPGDWSRDFAVDTTQHHSGNSSLLVKNQSASGSSGSAYRMLAVPATAGKFWVRFWIRSDMPIGGTDHNAFAGGSIGSSPNDLMIEFAEDVGIAFNTSDSDQWPQGFGRTSSGGTMPYTLPAATWECIEISYDGTGREQQLFINNVQLIDAMNYPASTEALSYFKFGFDAYHGPARQVWFDDVAVAPSRIGGCPTVAMSNQ